jgi:type IV pilus assembly protein PilV
MTHATPHRCFPSDRVRARARGFSLVEVLVALVVTGIGILGLAKIQGLAYASTGNASERSLAALEASSLVAAMRANRTYWSTTTTPLTVSIAGSATNPTVTVSAGDSTLANTSYTCTYGTAGTNAPCTPAQLAAADLYEWATALNSLLPAVAAKLDCTTPTTGAAVIGCTIQITWTERNAAINSQSQGNALSAPTYTLYVVP